MDFIDLLIDTSEEFLTGYYYKRRPKSKDDGRVTFLYKQLNPNARVFNTVLGNIRADSETYAIKTNDHCGFKVGGYVSTQNGKIWQITEVVTNEQADGANEVLRWFKTAKQSDCSVRLLRVDNLWTEQTYSECVVNMTATLNGAPIKILTAKIQVYESDTPTETNLATSVSANKTFPFILRNNTLTYFAPQGVTSIVTLQVGNNGLLGQTYVQTVRVDRKDTITDNLSVPVAIEG